MSVGQSGLVVHLNDFLDNNAVLLKRLEYAFGVDGTNFWQNFFLCEQRHSEDKLIYLFTQSQLKYMYKWYNNKKETSEEDVKKNLNLSRQIFFNAPEGEKKRSQYGYYKKRFSYIRYEGYTLSIPDTFRFSSSKTDSENNKKTIFDFFDENFIKSLKDTSIQESDHVSLLIEVKKQIANKIFSPRDKKWLRYLGNKISNDHSIIEYCNEIDPRSLS